MEKVREWSKNPLYVGIAAGLLGLIIGWILIGWTIWPVTYYDAAPANMRADLRIDYLRMAIDSYSKNPDVAQAKRRYQELGPEATAALDEIRKAPGKTFPDDIIKFSNALALPAGQVVPPVQATAVPAATAVGGATVAAVATKAPVAGQVTPTMPASTVIQPTQAAVVQPTAVLTKAAAGTDGSSSTLLIVLCLVLLIIGGALAYVFLMRNRQTGGDIRQMISGMGGKKSVAQTAQTDYQAAQGIETPIAQFMTTYKLGVDLYDDSFSIDSPTGEFLGECGVGISKPIGVGDPKKVTAFEVWLFDKNDIQTVTKVLMSENAFNDPATLQELQAKGEPVLVTPGSEIYLQTATLQLTARVVDMSYGQGALATNSFFDRMTLELAIWPKPAQ